MANLPTPGSTDPALYSDGWNRAAIAVALGATVFRIIYLLWFCPYDLAQDEAHYWDWSRNLDWSYYSKGPLVAWLIALSDFLTRSWLPLVGGDPAFGVRLFAPISGGAFLLGLFTFTRQTCHDGRGALIAMLAAMTVPPIAVAGLLMTIDAPFTCLWVWALVFAHRAVGSNRLADWITLGAIVGLGILAKYTMVLFIPSLALAMLMDNTWRKQLLRPAPWIGIGATVLLCMPIVAWNINNDFVTFRHVGNLAGVDRPAGGIRWMGPLQFLGGQLALLMGFWLLAWLAALIALRPWRQNDSSVRLAWWLSAPTFMVFGLFSFKTGGGEINWPVTAYLAGVPLVLVWFNGLKGQFSVVATRSAIAMLALGTILVFFLHASPVVQPLLARLAGPPTESNPTPLRRLDPTCRLMGWKQLANYVDFIRVSDPSLVVAVHRWSSVGLLGFYCQGRPRVESLGAALGDRHSQYDLWPHPVAQPDKYRGRDFIIVDAPSEALIGAFDKVETPIIVTATSPGGFPVARWSVVVARGFRGFDPAKLPPRGW